MAGDIGQQQAVDRSRIITEDGRRGWLSVWTDEPRTWWHLFEPDDGGESLKFNARQGWVGNARDEGNGPKKRDHLQTRKAGYVVFVFAREKDADKVLAALAQSPAPSLFGNAK